MKEFVEIKSIEFKNSRLTANLEYSANVRKYFKQSTFWVEYSADIDLSLVPKSILAIPVIGTIAPVCWSIGADLRASQVDRVFAEALTSIAQIFQQMYPDFKTSEMKLIADLVDETPLIRADSIGCLFSGGVDSNSTLVDHYDKITDLLSVWGADVATENKELWQLYFIPLVLQNPVLQGKNSWFIKSNLREVLDQLTLKKEFGHMFAGTDWWGGVHHGIGISSLMAPLAFYKGIRKIYIASSHSQAFSEPWGSTPSTDNRIAWSGTTISHDGYNYTRQGKIHNVLAPFVKKGVELRIGSCYQTGRGDTQLNCGVCEKCMRTQVGFLFEGVDPSLCGFNFQKEILLKGRARLEAHSYHFGKNEVFMWKDIQQHIPSDLAQVPDIQGSRGFLEWLQKQDISSWEAPAVSKSKSFIKSYARNSAERVFQLLPFRVRQYIRRHLLMR